MMRGGVVSEYLRGGVVSEYLRGCMARMCGKGV